MKRDLLRVGMKVKFSRAMFPGQWAEAEVVAIGYLVSIRINSHNGKPIPPKMLNVSSKNLSYLK